MKPSIFQIEPECSRDCSSREIAFRHYADTQLHKLFFKKPNKTKNKQTNEVIEPVLVNGIKRMPPRDTSRNRICRPFHHSSIAIMLLKNKIKTKTWNDEPSTMKIAYGTSVTCFDRSIDWRYVFLFILTKQYLVGRHESWRQSIRQRNLIFNFWNKKQKRSLKLQQNRRNNMKLLCVSRRSSSSTRSHWIAQTTISNEPISLDSDKLEFWREKNHKFTKRIRSSTSSSTAIHSFIVIRISEY